MINNGTPHLKSLKNQNRRAALGRPAIKLLGGGGGGGGGGGRGPGGGGGFNQFVVNQPSPLIPPWFLRHLVVRLAWKIPNS